MESFLRDPEDSAILKAQTMITWNIDFSELKTSENISRILPHRGCPQFVAIPGGRGQGPGMVHPPLAGFISVSCPYQEAVWFWRLLANGRM